MPWSKGNSSTLSKEDCLDANILVAVLELVSRIQNFQVYQGHDVISLSPKNKRAQYEKSQKSRENKKG